MSARILVRQRALCSTFHVTLHSTRMHGSMQEVHIEFGVALPFVRPSRRRVGKIGFRLSFPAVLCRGCRLYTLVFSREMGGAEGPDRVEEVIQEPRGVARASREVP